MGTEGLVVAAAAAVVITKGLDCASTLREVPAATAETNPFARLLMANIGVRPAVALVFLLATVWMAALAAAALAIDAPVLHVVFVATAAFVAFVQGAVALTNWTGRWNIVTRAVLRLHTWLHTWLH